jgi:hypothetical protein
MARVQVVADDGHVTLTERVTPETLHEEHFRIRLAERIEWATADAAEHDQEETAPR